MKYFACGKLGHLARSCRTPHKEYSEQGGKQTNPPHHDQLGKDRKKIISCSTKASNDKRSTRVSIQRCEDALIAVDSSATEHAVINLL